MPLTPSRPRNPKHIKTPRETFRRSILGVKLAPKDLPKPSIRPPHRWARTLFVPALGDLGSGLRVCHRPLDKRPSASCSLLQYPDFKLHRIILGHLEYKWCTRPISFGTVFFGQSFLEKGSHDMVRSAKRMHDIRQPLRLKMMKYPLSLKASHAGTKPWGSSTQSPDKPTSNMQQESSRM